MKVYRVEDEDGIGPFRTCVALPHHYDPPGPITDGVFGCPMTYHLEMTFNTAEMMQYRYGFQSREKLLDWFEIQDIKYFKHNGLNVYAYEVEDTKVKLGGHQCAFKPEDASHKQQLTRRRTLH